jgi:uncharacterized protein YdaU (DUF1376 family)
MVEKGLGFDTIVRPERPSVDAPEPLPDNPMEVGQPLADRNRTGKSPAFQFYPKDFLSDANVMAMSLTELGAYWKLTCICWNEGSLPADTKSLARLLGTSAGHASKLWPAIAPCFKERDGRLMHPRLEGERRKQAEYRAKQADNGRKGGRPSGKGLGSSGLTQTQANESSSSPISNLQSSSARKNTRTTARETPIDEQAQKLLSAYPPQGACSIHAVTAALGDVLRGKPAGEFEALLERLESHKRSARWHEQAGRFIPRLDRYLSGGTHAAVLPSVEDVEREAANAKLPAWARS